MLSRKQFEILVTLASSGSLSQRAVAERTSQSVGNVNRILKELGALGYVDGARTPAGITAAGLTVLEPYRVKRAVFLAAGFGARLIPVTLNTPKPLVRVRGKRIIDGLIDECLAIGITEIYIVRGYLGEQFDQLLSNYPSVQFIENPVYNETNNISSALCARYLLRNCHVFESDLIIRPGLIRKYHYTSDFLACYQQRCDDWCFKMKDGTITEEKLGDYDAWKNCGISYWNESDGRRLAEHIRTAYERPGGKELFWEEVPLWVFNSSYHVEIVPCSERDVIEIDTYNELKMADGTYAV